MTKGKKQNEIVIDIRELVEVALKYSGGEMTIEDVKKWIEEKTKDKRR